MVDMKVSEFYKRNLDFKPIFSILIPTWNNLPYLKNCIQSIEKNSTFKHQIIIHINHGEDGTLAWVKENGYDFTFSESNAGVCYAFNAASALAASDLLVLSDDDMYYCPNWDKPLLEEVSSLNHVYFCINGTAIEPKSSGNACVIAPKNFGTTIEEFNEDALLKSYDTYSFKNWTGGNWYPMVLHKYIWQLIGGLSIEFSPGMGSDPDMMMKLWHAGVRYYKGIESSRVYHFMSRSVSRVKKNNGRKQFLHKWNISIGTLFKFYLKFGGNFNGPLTEPTLNSKLKFRLIKDWFKRRIT